MSDLQSLLVAMKTNEKCRTDSNPRPEVYTKCFVCYFNLRPSTSKNLIDATLSPLSILRNLR